MVILEYSTTKLWKQRTRKEVFGTAEKEVLSAWNHCIGVIGKERLVILLIISPS